MSGTVDQPEPSETPSPRSKAADQVVYADMPQSPQSPPQPEAEQPNALQYASLVHDEPAPSTAPPGEQELAQTSEPNPGPDGNAQPEEDSNPEARTDELVGARQARRPEASSAKPPSQTASGNTSTGGAETAPTEEGLSQEEKEALLEKQRALSAEEERKNQEKISKAMGKIGEKKRGFVGRQFDKVKDGFEKATDRLNQLGKDVKGVEDGTEAALEAALAALLAALFATGAALSLAGKVVKWTTSPVWGPFAYAYNKHKKAQSRKAMPQSDLSNAQLDEEALINAAVKRKGQKAGDEPGVIQPDQAAVLCDKADGVLAAIQSSRPADAKDDAVLPERQREMFDAMLDMCSDDQSRADYMDENGNFAPTWQDIENLRKDLAAEKENCQRMTGEQDPVARAQSEAQQSHQQQPPAPPVAPPVSQPTSTPPSNGLGEPLSGPTSPDQGVSGPTAGPTSPPQSPENLIYRASEVSQGAVEVQQRSAELQAGTLEVNPDADPSEAAIQAGSSFPTTSYSSGREQQHEASKQTKMLAGVSQTQGATATMNPDSQAAIARQQQEAQERATEASRARAKPGIKK